MHRDLLTLLRCPFCGGTLTLDDAHPSNASAREIHDGILACACCTFPVVDGIPVLHLHPSAEAAQTHLKAGQPTLARRAMFGLTDDAEAERVDGVLADPEARFQDVVAVLGTHLEGGYFLYRFSDPTFVVAEAVVQAVAGHAVAPGDQVIDVCGGAGHLTRVLAQTTGVPPVLADLFYAKLWLARRFTAPQCRPVCCDGNAPLPFARGAFAFAMCADALMYLWQKRQFVGELFRLVDGHARATVLLNHVHSQLVWSPSHGNALPPAAYRSLCEQATPQIFGEGRLFTDLISTGTIDLTHGHSDEAVANDAALTLVASRVPQVFGRHARPAVTGRDGEWRINPLYAVHREGAAVAGTLHFPSDDYEDEYGACRAYLPDEIRIDDADWRALGRAIPPALRSLVERRAILSLPLRYL